MGIADTALGIALAAGKALEKKLDGWGSTLTGVGLAATDKAASYSFYTPALLTPRECSDLYHFDDLANTIISAVPEDACREGIEVVRQVEQGPDKEDIDASQAQEESKQVQDRLTELGALGVTQEAMIWARAMGGAGVLGLFEGTGLPHEPLDESRITGIERLIQIDREDLFPSTYYRSGPKAGEVETFNLNLVTQSGLVTTNLRIHESRVVWFRGASTSRKERLKNQGWDHSVLQRIYTILQQVNGAWGAVVHMMHDMSQAVLKMRGLIDSIGANKDEDIQARITLMNLTRSIARMLVLDSEGESLEVVERSSVVGADALVDKLFLRLAAAARMPVTRLMGQSPAGLNATGASDIRWWYDTINVCRTMEVKPRYLRLVRWVAIEQGLEPTGWDLRFPPLWQMTPAEEATLRKAVADTDAVYINAGVVLPEEVTLSRWGSGHYSPETTVDIDVRKAVLEQIASAEGQADTGGEQGTVGARMAAVLDLIERIKNKTVTRESAIALLKKFFAMSDAEAEETLGPDLPPEPKPVVVGLPGLPPVPGKAPTLPQEPPKEPPDDGSAV